MHGLVNRAVECFVRDTYGADSWRAVVQAAALDCAEFEAMLRYPDAVTQKVLVALVAQVGLDQSTLLEDIGTYLVSHPNAEAVRRLLRFSGVSFLDFLHSLDDLPARARLAVPDLDMPSLELYDHGAHSFSLTVRHDVAGFGYVMMGILRTMADDYGALAILDLADSTAGVEIIQIQLVEMTFTDGRSFALGAAKS